MYLSFNRFNLNARAHKHRVPSFTKTISMMTNCMLFPPQPQITGLLKKYINYVVTHITHKNNRFLLKKSIPRLEDVNEMIIINL